MSIVRVEAGLWRDAVAARLTDGAHFAGAWAAGDQWRAAFVAPDHGTHVLGCTAADGSHWALQAFPQELHREDRLSRARRARDDVRPPGDEAAVEHLIKTRDAGPDLGRGRQRITCGGRGGVEIGGGSGAFPRRSLSSESHASASFIAF